MWIPRPDKHLLLTVHVQQIRGEYDFTNNPPLDQGLVGTDTAFTERCDERQMSQEN